MNAKGLTYEEALLLQRYADGQAAKGDEQAAEALLLARPAAKVYLAVLKEVKLAAQMALEEAVGRATLPDAARMIELAQSAAGLAELDLVELAPLLERYHDGEVDEVEAAAVLAMMEHRQDVAAYLLELDGLSTSIRQAHLAAQVDLSNFWRELESKLDETKKCRGFDPDEHQVLLHRYHDLEVSVEEGDLVQSWIDGKDRAVDDFLGALAEIHLGVNAAIETAQEEAPLYEIWAGVEARLDELEQDKRPEKVVSLEDRRQLRAKRAIWQSPLLAAVAAVLLLVLGGLLGPRLITPEQIIEKRTVVIFDSVEYSPGSSVMIHSPMLANHGAAEDELPILWILEDEEDLLEDSASGSEGAAPKHKFTPGPI